jgi:hypothetical protein
MQALKGAGLLGAGAYGYHYVENTDLASGLKSVVGLINNGASRDSSATASTSGSMAGGEVCLVHAKFCRRPFSTQALPAFVANENSTR